eukprot:3024199-Rhodomonas_salina.1
MAAKSSAAPNVETVAHGEVQAQARAGGCGVEGLQTTSRCTDSALHQHSSGGKGQSNVGTPSRVAGLLSLSRKLEAKLVLREQGGWQQCWGSARRWRVLTWTGIGLVVRERGGGGGAFGMQVAGSSCLELERHW